MSADDTPTEPGLRTVADVERLIDDRPAAGVFRVHRDAFIAPDVYEREMVAIFEKTWVFVGLESQAPRPHDFFTTRIGRQPVLVSRDADGQLRCVLNSCRHRGMMVVTQRSGNRKVHTCRYHNWSYGSGGENLHIAARAEGRYPPWFDSADHGLVPTARFDSYRGFLFASLSNDVPPLPEHLGDARFFLDLIVDQAGSGLEYAPGSVSYTFNANWKLQIENSMDVYHFASTHASYVDLLSRRPANAFAGGMPPPNTEVPDHGTFSFGRGHAVMWRRRSRASQALIDRRKQSYASGIGETGADWAASARNLTIFPNLQIVDNVTSTMLRVLHPMAANLTEMRTHCVAPIGEDADLRSARIRDYEDFFNPSGLATPDDNTIYELSQAGFQAQAAGWTEGYLRGLNAEGAPTVNPYVETLNLRHSEWSLGPRLLGDETCFHDAYREWRRLLAVGLKD
jgi:phenylpropionate dioxygenase-like ring-hydroxylating dioxygenase large terminal subunit